MFVEKGIGENINWTFLVMTWFTLYLMNTPAQTEV